MTSSHIRKRLRVDRQMKRKTEIPPDFMKKNEVAAWHYIIFGGSLENSLAEVARFQGAMSSKRAQRALRKQKNDLAKRKEAIKRQEMEKKARMERAAQRMKNRPADQRGATKQMTRKRVT